MLFPIDLPPGVARRGTEYRSKGRYYDCNLVRWYEGDLRPMGGWQAHSTSKVTGAARAMLTWVDAALNRWIAVGTDTHLQIMDRVGELFDITPAGYTAGRPDATVGGGFGTGLFGEGTFGTPRTDSGLVQDATVWSLDQLGGKLLGCNADDGRLYEWDGNTAHVATVVANAPVNNRAMVVTDEGAVMLLGAAGDPKTVQWSDLFAETTWAPQASNQARYQRLQTDGRLMCAKRSTGVTLVFTDLDVFAATYIGTPYVYGFKRVGSGCGAVSQACAVSTDTLTAWMGRGGFWTYDGYVQPLESEVDDYVFTDINRDQISKVFGQHNPIFGEIAWAYPSSASTEIDRYVRWNYRENHWAIGQLARLCGAEQGVYHYPLMIGPDGTVYEHETGWSYDGVGMPYAETGPIELGKGDRVMQARYLVPDERTLGQVQATFYVKNWPNAVESVAGPYSMMDPTGIRFAGRQARMRLTGVALGDWRVGIPRLELQAGGAR